MAQVVAKGNRTLIATGYTAHGEVNQSDGIGGTYEIASFTNFDEALEAARGKGVQGDSGNVSEYSYWLYDTGAVLKEQKKIWGRRRDKKGYYTMGLMSEEVKR